MGEKALHEEIQREFFDSKEKKCHAVITLFD